MLSTLKFYKKPLTPGMEHLPQGFLSVTESALPLVTMTTLLSASSTRRRQVWAGKGFRSG